MREVDVQALGRLEIARRGWLGWRNNVGVLMDSRGVPVRFGLANDSKTVNAKVKSGDVIGIIPTLITQQMVGTTLGQFASWEFKHAGWKFNPNDEHERAQMRWAELVLLAGGHAQFVTDPTQL